MIENKLLNIISVKNSSSEIALIAEKFNCQSNPGPWDVRAGTSDVTAVPLQKYSAV